MIVVAASPMVSAMPACGRLSNTAHFEVDEKTRHRGSGALMLTGRLGTALLS